MSSDLLYLADSYLTEFDCQVVAVDETSVALDRTAFYPTGGGQPCDFGELSGLSVIQVSKRDDFVWHELQCVDLPRIGDHLHGKIDWPRRHKLMRTHTALHILCGVIWNNWQVPVTGGNMEPLVGRMDFEFDPLPPDFARSIEESVNLEIAADRLVEVRFLPRDFAIEDQDLIRTKVNMIPDSVKEIRIVDIVGLDKQADGGTHVHSTSEVGRFTVVKTESKGKGNKRLRIQIADAI